MERSTEAVVRELPAAEPKPAGHRRTLRPVPPPERSPDTADLKEPSLYINRELSWLEFNHRVLSQALDSSHPLLERGKFLAIAAGNLDEFFMIRVATTLKKLKAGIEDIAPDGMNTEQELSAMRMRAYRMLEELPTVWEDLRRLLALENIHFLDIADWTAPVRDHLA